MPETDEQLLTQASNGDASAFSELYDRYQNAIYRYLLAVSGEQFWAEDMFQEVWLRVANQVHNKKSLINFKGWLFTVAANLFRDELRKKYLRRFFFPQSLDDAPGIEKKYVDHSSEAGKSFELQNDLMAALQKLTGKQRTIFLLAAHEGFKMVEIAQILHLAVGTVKATLHKTILKLQKELYHARL